MLRRRLNIKRFFHWVVAPAVIIVSLIVHMHLGLHWTAALYESAQLFILSANTQLGTAPDLSVAAFIALWAVRAFAPLVTVAAVIDVLLTIGIFGVVPFYWRGHTVICGAGRLGGAFARRLLEKNMPVVIIERDALNPNLEDLRRAGAKVVLGDASIAQTLKSARLGVARFLISATQDDILNINICTRAAKNAQTHLGSSRLECLCFIYDLRLKRRLVAKDEGKAKAKDISYVNAYQLAAIGAVKQLKESTGSHAPTLYLIAGYGRFGRSILAELLKDQSLAQEDFFVIDQHLNLESAELDFEKRYPDKEPVKFVKNEMLDPVLWKKLKPEIEKVNGNVVVMVCTDSDTGNLVFGLKLLEQYEDDYPQMQVYLRLFRNVDLLEGDKGVKGIYPLVLWKAILEGLSKNNCPVELLESLKNNS